LSWAKLGVAAAMLATTVNDASSLRIMPFPVAL
jgi:hypothetical protein